MAREIAAASKAIVDRRFVFGKVARQA